MEWNEEELRSEVIDFKFEVKEGSISIEKDEFLIKSALNPTSIVCYLHLSATHLYPCLDYDQCYKFLAYDLGPYALVDYNATTRLQILQELNNLGIHNPNHHRMLFQVLNLHNSRLLSDEDYLPIVNRRRFLEIKVNFTTYRHEYYFGDGDEDSSQCRPVPTAASAIDSLDKVEVELLDAGTKRGNCIICFEGIHVERLAAKLPCKHLFHEGCAVKWLQRSHFCPLCRFEMPVDG